ncbi:mechanosensitive ion channel family protein [Pleurocapsales cyanobacterium LEGE 10410]|nr:mechanosensitive ion channel family protein [Pleurocapsales cyanobacterium LEGE 10410]
MSFNFLLIEFLNNELLDYLIAATILLSCIILIRIFRRLGFKNLRKWAAKTDNVYDDAIVNIIERDLIPIAYIASTYLAINNLTLHPILESVVEVTVVILSTIFAIKLFTASVEYLIKIYWITYQPDNANLEQSINALLPAIRVVIWLIGIVFLLDNLGFDISAVVASLGIGGVAIALASQGVLQDLFSYFSILLDRPFELGDFIIVGDYLGTVEYVGIKTTRLRSISGEEIVIANTDLTGSRIRNFKRMRQRRIVFKFGVVYETSAEKLAQIPALIQEIIDHTENATCDRAHFSGYGEYSLDFEVVYFVNTSDYNIYMNAQQQINLAVKAKFAQHGIEFAYPTQINYLNSLSADSFEDRQHQAMKMPS